MKSVTKPAVILYWFAAAILPALLVIALLEALLSADLFAYRAVQLHEFNYWHASTLPLYAPALISVFAFSTLGFLAYLVARPSYAQTLACATLVLTFTPLWVLLPTGLVEPWSLGFAFLIAALFTAIAKRTPRRTKRVRQTQLFTIALIGTLLVAALFRISWAPMIIVAATLLAPWKKRWQTLAAGVGVVVSVLTCMLVGLPPRSRFEAAPQNFVTNLRALIEGSASTDSTKLYPLYGWLLIATLFVALCMLIWVIGRLVTGQRATRHQALIHAGLFAGFTLPVLLMLGLADFSGEQGLRIAFAHLFFVLVMTLLCWPIAPKLLRGVLVVAILVGAISVPAAVNDVKQRSGVNYVIANDADIARTAAIIDPQLQSSLSAPSYWCHTMMLATSETTSKLAIWRLLDIDHRVTFTDSTDARFVLADKPHELELAKRFSLTRLAYVPNVGTLFVNDQRSCNG